MKEILSIRLNDQDKEHINTIKCYLEEKLKELPPSLRDVTDTDVAKYAIILTSERIKKDANTNERD